MSEDSTIMEMMEEMEDYFNERDRLFKEREEAYQDRYEALLLRESSLKEKEEALETSRLEHEDKVRPPYHEAADLFLRDIGFCEQHALSLCPVHRTLPFEPLFHHRLAAGTDKAP